MKPYEYVITYSIQNHQKIIKIRRSFCVQEIRLKINTGDNAALKSGMILCIHSLYFSCCSFWSFMGFFLSFLVNSTLASFPVLAHLSTNQHSTNSIIHIKQQLGFCRTVQERFGGLETLFIGK